jgi:hypothetical protein
MYNRRIRKIENSIDKHNPDLLVMPEIDEYRIYKNRLWENPQKEFVLNVSRSMMYLFNRSEVDISDKQCVLKRIRNVKIARLKSRGFESPRITKNSKFIDADTAKMTVDDQGKSC